MKTEYPSETPYLGGYEVNPGMEIDYCPSPQNVDETPTEPFMPEAEPVGMTAKTSKEFFNFLNYHNKLRPPFIADTAPRPVLPTPVQLPPLPQEEASPAPELAARDVVTEGVRLFTLLKTNNLKGVLDDIRAILLNNLGTTNPDDAKSIARIQGAIMLFDLLDRQSASRTIAASRKIGVNRT